LALTILRCTGNGVGTPEEQEDGQMQGTYVFDFALFPHTGDWETAQVWREAHNFNVPLRAVQTDVHAGSLPSTHSFLAVGPDTMVPTSIKRSEDGKSLVLRAVNYGSHPVAARFGSALPVPSAQSARLDETPTGDLPVTQDSVTLEAAPRRIVTVLLGNRED
jgi:alpha-mannosidase